MPARDRRCDLWPARPAEWGAAGRLLRAGGGLLRHLDALARAAGAFSAIHKGREQAWASERGPSRTQPCRQALGPQVRCAQLDKEASELRLENETLLRTVEDGKHAAVQSAQVGTATAAASGTVCFKVRSPCHCSPIEASASQPGTQFAALEARAQSLQDELTAAYKEKAALAEQSLQATRQLQVSMNSSSHFHGLPLSGGARQTEGRPP